MQRSRHGLRLVAKTRRTEDPIRQAHRCSARRAKVTGCHRVALLLSSINGVAPVLLRLAESAEIRGNILRKLY